MKKICFAALLLLAFVLLAVTVTASQNEPPAILHTSENGESINIFPTDHVFYLPSSIDITKVYFDISETLFYEIDGSSFSGALKADEALDLSSAKTTDERNTDCYRIRLGSKNHMEEYTFYADGEIASLFVTTSKGLSYIESSKSNRDKGAKLLLLDDHGKVEYSDFTKDTTSEIKGRGNATFSYYKKPYQIKLDEKTALLGMEKAKTWILLAGYTDQSALHNAIAFTLADALGIPYAIDYRFVSLYIDGAYRGLYMICEKVQIDKARINIHELEKDNESANEGRELDSFPILKESSDNAVKESILKYYTYCQGMQSPEDITGGYLVELDNIRGLSEPCHFQTENGNVYVVKSPEFASKEEMAYISALFADMEEAIFSSTGYNRKGKHFSEYIDMKSFADIYTLQELLKNWDAYLSSMFFFKDADQGDVVSKIYMGPLWDMDNTLGNINFNHEYGIDTTYLWAQNGVFNSYPRDLAKKLMSHEEFQIYVQESYDVAYSAVTEYLSAGGWLEETVEMISPSVMMDRTRWKLYDNDAWLLSSAGRKTSVKFVHFEVYGTANDQTPSTALGFFRYYLSERADALLMLIGKGAFPAPEETTTETTTERTTAKEETTASTNLTETSTNVSETTTTNTLEPPANENSVVAYVVCGIGVALIILVAVFLIFKHKQTKKQ